MKKLKELWEIKMKRFENKFVEKGPSKIYTREKYTRLMTQVDKLHQTAIDMVKFMIGKHVVEIAGPMHPVLANDPKTKEKLQEIWKLKKKGNWVHIDWDNCYNADGIMQYINVIKNNYNDMYTSRNIHLIDILNAYRRGTHKDVYTLSK